MLPPRREFLPQSDRWLIAAQHADGDSAAMPGFERSLGRRTVLPVRAGMMVRGRDLPAEVRHSDAFSRRICDRMTCGREKSGGHAGLPVSRNMTACGFVIHAMVPRAKSETAVAGMQAIRAAAVRAHRRVAGAKRSSACTELQPARIAHAEATACSECIADASRRIGLVADNVRLLVEMPSCRRRDQAGR